MSFRIVSKLYHIAIRIYNKNHINTDNYKRYFMEIEAAAYMYV